MYSILMFVSLDEMVGIITSSLYLTNTTILC